MVLEEYRRDIQGAAENARSRGRSLTCAGRVLGVVTTTAAMAPHLDALAKLDPREIDDVARFEAKLQHHPSRHKDEVLLVLPSPESIDVADARHGLWGRTSGAR